ncbi:MAG: Tn3 family transposase [Rickettsiales bacterium]|nr:Tn3 family transposase [Rickettsiales bacterium]
MDKRNRKYQKNRIALLSNAEIDQLFNIPTFNSQEMNLFFDLSDNDHLLLENYKTIKLKIYFIIQLGYFRTTQRFYNFNLEDVPEIVSYLANKYFNPIKIPINYKPYREIIKAQQNIILKLYDYKDWSSSLIPQVSAHLAELIKYYPKPEIAFSELLKYFEEMHIIMPTYRIFQDIFTKVLSKHNARLEKLILTIPINIQNLLDKLIGNDIHDSESQNQKAIINKINQDDIIVELNTIRYDQKDFKYTASHLEIQKVQKISSLYEFSKSFLPNLNISKNSIRHYCDLTSNYSTSRLKKLRKPQQFLYLLCFIYHRYQQFMDNLITTFSYHVNLITDKGKTYANDEFLKYTASLVLDFPNLAKFLQWFPEEDKNKDLSYAELTQQAYKILPQPQFAVMATYLEGKIFDKTKAKWEFYAKSSALISRYLRPVILNASFELINHKSNLLQLITLLKEHYSKKKNPRSLKIPSNTDLIKEKSMLPYLISSTEPNYLDPHRLEFYVYLKMYHHIDRGRLCCNDSISFSDLDQDLVSDSLVDQVEEISKKFSYNKIPIFCDQRLDQLLEELDEALINTNANISSGLNKDIKLITSEDGTISWNLNYDAKEPLSEAFFSNLPKIEIADLLKFVGDNINLWDGFSHIKNKYVKRKKAPIIELNACLLCEAFGISITEIAEMSDLNVNSLCSTRQDFIRVDSLLDGNDIASNYIYSLPIVKKWNLLDGEILADADGKKHPTTNSNIQSRFSTKYIGKGKGISILSLVANYVIVNSKTIGLNEYEAHSLYDMIYGNNTDIIINYVTGDNHSLNPINFVVLDSIDVRFLPGIKNLKEAANNIYSTKKTSDYAGLITPKDQIKKSIIKSSKRQITRVLLSLILQKETQTTIVRKLSKHNRYARLKAALHEYNKIFKSIHVLNMIDDINLRKAIKAARNRTESYHQLQGAIRKVYHGIFKGKRIIDNNVSAHAVRLLANCIIAYNSFILNILYERLVAAKAPQDLIDKFIRISPIAWDHIIFTGRYNFNKNDTTVDLETMLNLLEEKLKKGF